jgi:HK97 gp10 family phage protein
MKFTARATIKLGDISGIIARVGQGMYDGVTAASEIIQAEAQRLVPVDTGALRDSIDVQVYRGVQNIQRGGALAAGTFSVTGIVSPHTDYAEYVEFGTGQRGAASAGAGEGPYTMTWPGMPAQPYMRPAAASKSEDAIQAVKDAVTEMMRP